MKAYGQKRRQRCCPGHDPDSKKFDRANWKRRWNTVSRKAVLRSIKRRGRVASKKIEQE